MKEIKLSPNISEHDISYRIKQTNKFLEKGIQVKVTLTYKGRELVHRERGYLTLHHFISQCNGVKASGVKYIDGKRKSIQIIINPRKKNEKL